MPPLPLLAVATLLGDVAWPGLQPAAEVCVAGVAMIAALTMLRPSPRASTVGLAAAGLLLGLSLPGRIPAPASLDGEGRIRGRVVTPASGSLADVALTSWAPLGEDPTPVTGRIRVRFPDRPPPPGTAVLALGTAHRLDPTRLPGEPDPAWEASRSGVSHLFRARSALAVRPDPRPPRVDGTRHPGLVLALWNGDRSGIPDDEATLLRRTGTWHLVCISGLHIGIAAALGWGIGWVATRPLALLGVFRPLPWLCAAPALAAAFSYTALSGYAQPAVRASWMAVAGLGCAALGRRPGGWEALSVALLASLWGDPGAVADAGFQLSFGAVAGILLVHDRVTRWLPPDSPRLARLLTTALGTSVGATVGTLPVVAWVFQSLSPLSVVANLWAVPWMGSVGAPAIIASQLLPEPLGSFTLAVGDAALDVGLWGLRWVDVEPWHPAVGPAGALLLAIAPLVRRRWWAWGGLTALALGWSPAPPAELTVRFLAIGQGDATLVEWPNGARWLVDGGPPGDDLLRYLRRRGIRRLDRVVLTHPHPDHFGGLLPVARELPIADLVLPYVPEADGRAMAELLLRVTAGGGFLRLPNASPPGLAILHPLAGWRSPARDPVNDESVVVRFGLGSRRFLLTGDVERAAEAHLVATSSRLHADVLKVPHHGSATSSTAAFVEAVDPSIAVVPCGYDNRYRHPRAEALAAYRGRRVYRTDQDGTIVVRTDGRSLSVERTAAPDPVVARAP